jgi:F-type H+-transporting ATPase subunit gamma
MANLKELRGRIKSVASIAQITRAMEMVASMKMRKVQGKAQSFHPYTEEIRSMMDRIAARVQSGGELPLFQVRPVQTTAFFLLTSDRGLCGSYNSNILLELRRQIEAIKAQDPNRKFKFYVYGRKGYTWLTRRGYDVERFFVEPPLDKANFDAAKIVGQALVEAFTKGTVDEVRIFYSRFQSMIKFVPTSKPFLPVTTVAVGKDAQQKFELDFLLEPDAATVMNRLLPRYLETVVFDAMLQALASEHSSRRMAMKTATDAAVRMNKQLKKVYNRARQENITKELLDIVGGASAVQ